MKKYVSLILIQFKANFQYRISTYAGIVVGILQVCIYYYIWSSVFLGKTDIEGYSKTQIITYSIFSIVLYRLIEFGITLRVSDLVRSGEISLYLVKPISFVKNMFYESVGSLFASLFTMILPITVFSVFVFDIYIQNDFITILLFCISILLAIAVSIYIDLIFGLLTFWTENGWGLRVIRQALIKLFSGAIVPFAFLPSWFSTMADYLPFKSLIEKPINIYLRGANIDTVKTLGFQLVWFIMLIIGTNLLFKYIIKRLNINGG